MKPFGTALVAVIVALASACGSSTTTPGATVSSVTVSGAAPGVGATAQFSATATLSNGTTQAATAQATWSTSNASVATVNSAGLVTGVGAGEADITATYQSTTGRLHVTIASQAVATFTVSGSVSDGTSGGMLPNITIQITDSGGVSRSAVTGSTGAFSIGGLPAGSATLTASAVSYQTTTRTLAIAADTRVDIVLPRVACTLTLTPATFSFRSSGGTGTVAVASQATGCAWQAKSNDAFITVASGGGVDAGTVTFTVAANTGVARTGTLTIAATTVTVSQDAAPVMQFAQYDATFKAPLCNTIGSGCDTGTLVSGWGSTEPNQPNTLFDSCPDGKGPGLAVVGSIRVSTLDSSALAPGKTVAIETLGFGSSADQFYVYVAPDAFHPAWTLVGSISSSRSGIPYRVETVLPEGTLVAVRVINLFARPLGPGPCGTGEDVDVDDLVFRVR